MHLASSTSIGPGGRPSLAASCNVNILSLQKQWLILLQQRASATLGSLRCRPPTLRLLVQISTVCVCVSVCMSMCCCSTGFISRHRFQAATIVFMNRQLEPTCLFCSLLKSKVCNKIQKRHHADSLAAMLNVVVWRRTSVGLYRLAHTVLDTYDETTSCVASSNPS